MTTLNYHHLRYFWVVAREGSIRQARAVLHLAQPTISMQIRTLERSLGVKLFSRVGRNLALTDAGRVVFQYADDIFKLGEELGDTLRGRPKGKPLTFIVGLTDSLPKVVVQRMLEPAWNQPENIRMICLEGSPAELLSKLAVHELDVMLSDAPAPPTVKVQAYSHLLGESPICLFGTASLVKRFQKNFPQSLEQAPFLLPTGESSVRHQLDTWFDRHGIRVVVRGEFADSALLKVMGGKGIGLFAAPRAVAREVQQQYPVKLLGELPEVKEQFYAISVERRLKHPCVVAVAEAARGELFA